MLVLWYWAACMPLIFNASVDRICPWLSTRGYWGGRPWLAMLARSVLACCPLLSGTSCSTHHVIALCCKGGRGWGLGEWCLLKKVDFGLSCWPVRFVLDWFPLLSARCSIHHVVVLYAVCARYHVGVGNQRGGGGKDLLEGSGSGLTCWPVIHCYPAHVQYSMSWQSAVGL